MTPMEGRRQRIAIIAMLLTVASAAVAAQAAPAAHVLHAAAAGSFPWSDPTLSPDQRAARLVAALTLEEKVALMHGTGDETGSGFVGWHTGVLPPIPRVGFPGLHFTDGPLGVRQHDEPATAMPSGETLAATFDRDLAMAYGRVLGGEARAKNNDVIFGPMVNMVRIYRGGRDFETLGEDPYLAAEIAASDIEGIQSQGEMATVKHWVANNQETDRGYTDAVVDERTLHEIYMPAFEASVTRAHAASVMAAYNRVNGAYNAENCPLQRGVLKGQFGFLGFIVSDYDSTHGSARDVNCGTDIEQPDGTNYGNLPSDVAAGRVSMATIDDAAFRILREAFRFGVFDRPACPDVDKCSDIDVAAHGSVVRQVAEAGMVLMKNDPVSEAPLLPLDPQRVRSIALIGPNVNRVPGGGGSSQVVPFYQVTPAQAITRRAGSAIQVRTEPGLPLVNSVPALGPLPSFGLAPTPNLGEDVALAASSDVAVVLVGDASTEGFDRQCLDLTCGGYFDFEPSADELIAAVAAVNPHTLVVLNSGQPDVIPWAGTVPAILESWYPGEEDGNALAAILFGDVNPSGKLPFTFPRNEPDQPAYSPAQYPGIAEEAHYSEGLFTGYRHFDKEGISPLFPFGHGLSYTSFSYRNLSVSGGAPAIVSFDVTNTGARAGAEVAQLYVTPPAGNAAGEPLEQLKGFTKVYLAPGETRHVSLPVDARAISHWDPVSHAWAVQPGCHGVLAGSSSRDIRLQGMGIDGTMSPCGGGVAATSASSGPPTPPSATPPPTEALPSTTASTPTTAMLLPLVAVGLCASGVRRRRRHPPISKR